MVNQVSILCQPIADKAARSRILSTRCMETQFYRVRGTFSRQRKIVKVNNCPEVPPLGFRHQLTSTFPCIQKCPWVAWCEPRGASIRVRSPVKSAGGRVPLPVPRWPGSASNWIPFLPGPTDSFHFPTSLEFHMAPDGGPASGQGVDVPTTPPTPPQV